VGDKLYFISIDFVLLPPPSYSRVFEYTFSTEALRQLGEGASNETGELGDGAVQFYCLEMYHDQLFVGVGSTTTGYNSTDAGIYRMRPSYDTTWTLDLTLASGAVGEVPKCMAVYKDRLFAGLQDYDSATQRLMVRSVEGVWAQSTSIGTAAGAGWVEMMVFGDNLYATSYEDVGGNDVTRIHKFDNSSWSVVKTIEIAANPKIGVSMNVHNGVLYVLCVNTAKEGMITYSSDGTNWTDQTTNLTSGATNIFTSLFA
jgi:hypothetical protein